MNELTPALPAPDYHPSGPKPGEAQLSTAFKLARYLRFLRQYWYIPVLTLMLGIMGEAAYVYFKEPTFVCRSSMWETLKLKLPEGALFAEDVNFLGTLSELLQSATLRNKALALLRSSPDTASSIPLGKDGQPPPVSILVNGSPKSSVFVIEAKSSNPTFTQTYLDALMQTYLEYKKTMRKEISGDTLASISEQMQKWERDLKTEQDALTAFEKTNNLAILQEEGTIAGGYLTKLKTELSDLQLEARLLNSSVCETNAANPVSPAFTNRDEAAATAISASPTNNGEMGTGARDIELLKMQRARLSKYLRPKHPKIVKLDEEIERSEKVQEIVSRQNLEQLAASRHANQLRIENTMEAIKEWETKVVEANNRIAEAERLKLNIQRTQSVYDRLALLVQNVGISRNIDQESLAILEPASAVKRSYKKEQTGLALSIFGGIGSGLGIICLISLRDDRLTSVMEINSTLGDAVVGVLPEVAMEGEGETPLLARNDQRYVYAESYRSLRSALLFLSIEGERPKTLLITSAMPGEGKSTVAINLARTLSFAGSRVLLVDADLRRGHLHQSLQMQPKPGLAELLHNDCEAHAVLQTNCLPNLFFISRGTNPGHPGDLFLGSSLDQILARWRQEFDYVVIDSSPIFAADDTSCLAPKVDGTLFVVRSHHSSARGMREALELLAQRQARIIGVVFNGIDASKRSYPYYKYADYSTPQAPA